MVLTIINKLFLSNIVLLLAAYVVTYKGTAIVEKKRYFCESWGILTGMFSIPWALLNIWLF